MRFPNFCPSAFLATLWQILELNLFMKIQWLAFGLIQVLLYLLIKPLAIILSVSHSSHSNSNYLYHKLKYTSKLILNNFKTLKQAQEWSSKNEIPLLTIQVWNSKNSEQKNQQSESLLLEIITDQESANFINNYFCVFLCNLNSKQTRNSDSVVLKFYKKEAEYYRIKGEDYASMIRNPICLTEQFQKIRNLYYDDDASLQQQSQYEFKVDTPEEEKEKLQKPEEANTMIQFFKLNQLCRFMQGLEQEDDIQTDDQSLQYHQEMTFN